MANLGTHLLEWEVKHRNFAIEICENPPLADPTFNVWGKIDILLGADVLKDISLENRIRDNGAVIRESLFGWVVSGPIKELTNPLDYTISSNVSVVSGEHG